MDAWKQLNEQVSRINAKLREAIATKSSPQAQEPPPPLPTSLPPASTSTHAPAAPRLKVDKMSAEVVDSNPYSRLMALQRMGIVKDYEKIRSTR